MPQHDASTTLPIEDEEYMLNKQGLWDLAKL